MKSSPPFFFFLEELCNLPANAVAMASGCSAIWQKHALSQADRKLVG